ncbi:MAG TPA: biopolymer transporter ExbD [Pyrinomonadaceae bacterium]|nr:biopolymer transporter ExbD [Pyrinomonadaceae bacterium]
MKPAIFKLGALAVLVTVGVVIFLFFAHRRSPEAAVPSAGNQVVTKCPDDLFLKGDHLVISVPNDDEFYIGKQRVDSSQISTRLREAFNKVSFCDRAVFIRAASEVSVETVVRLERQVRDADINHVEVVVDKKKPGGKH